MLTVVVFPQLGKVIYVMIVGALGLSTVNLEGHWLSGDVNLSKGKDNLFNEIEPHY